MSIRKTYGNLCIVEHKGKYVCMNTETMDVVCKGTYEECTKFIEKRCDYE